MRIIDSYSEFVMAMERVERRLRTVTTALHDAGIAYAVIGGNAVSFWVAQADPAATRTTKDVDLLVNRADLEHITQVMTELGFTRHDLRRLVLFTDPDEPSRRCGVHLVWAGEKVRPSYPVPAPRVDESRVGSAGMVVLDLPALIRMKLTSFRDIDRVHLADLLRVGMVNETTRDALPAELTARLQIVQSSMTDDADD